MKSFIVILLLIPLVSGTYFRKEKISKYEELKPVFYEENNSMLRGYTKVIKISTFDGNTYLITKNEDGEQITDNVDLDNWNVFMKTHFNGHKTVGEVLDEVKNLRGSY